MGTVGPEQRGIAAGTRTMLLNTGNVFSVGMVLALVAATVPPSTMLAIFAGEPTATNPQGLTHFVQGLNLAFAFMALMAVISAVLSAMRGEKAPRLANQSQTVSH